MALMSIVNGGPARFDLLEQPWIMARFANGTTTDVSLRDAFRRAHEIREIVGELPTQPFAILRLLLAILYRAPGGDSVDLTLWRHWRDNGLPLDLIDDYLDAFANRFDLLSPTQPFFQVADLELGNAVLMATKANDVTPLILDLPTRNRLFTTRSGPGAEDLSFAEAARWVVSAQSFDPSGIKSGAVGDIRVKNGKGSPIGVAWSGLLGGVFAQGETLRDTLMLNLVAPGPYLDAEPAADLPPWEESEPDTAAERLGLVPRGPVRLYTWQSRRIRLFAENDRVVGCLVANGDKLTPQSMQSLEPMTAWRFSEPQTKLAKQTTYMPREHQPGRALWRGVGALLPGISPIVPKRDVPSGLAPGLVQWLAQLNDEGLLDASAYVRLRAVGVVYGSNNSVVDEVLDDTVLLPLALLRERNRRLAQQAEQAVRLADEGVFALRRLAENLERAAGGVGEGARARAAEIAYAELDAPFRDWLESISDDSDPLDAIEAWKQTARGILRATGVRLVSQAGPAAWVGREVSRGGQTELITSPRAEGWFLRSLTKIFGKPTRRDEAA